MELLQTLQEPYAVRALIASSLVGLMCGTLGCFIVLRGMSLVGDALAHAILPGVVVAYVIFGYSMLGFFTGSVVAGLITAVGITWIQQKVNTKNDAAIGIMFTAMFSIGIMGISYISRDEGVHLDLKDFLFGNVLGVGDTDLILTGLVTVYVLLSTVVFYRYLFVTTFQSVIARTMGISDRLLHYFLMLLMSFAVVAALQTVGVILVVAMLITPASTALLLSKKLNKVLWIAAVLGLLSAVVGLIVAILLETTPGPAMAVVATLFYIIAVFFAPERGLIAKAIRRRALTRRIAREDILKAVFRMESDGEVKESALLKKIGIAEGGYRSGLSYLRKKGWMETDRLKLTEKGQEAGRALVRAHRLWETYLVDKMGLNEEQIHEEAERYEHLLTEEMLDAVDETLGYPTTDPHGSPIPTKLGLPDYPLSRMQTGTRATIADRQINEHVTAKLWQYGLLPGSDFTLKNKERDSVNLETKQGAIQLPKDVARQINVKPEVG